MSADLKCAKCGAGRGGVIDIARDGNKAKLLCFSCNKRADERAQQQKMRRL